jgi:hypothetical protein
LLRTTETAILNDRAKGAKQLSGIDRHLASSKANTSKRIIKIFHVEYFIMKNAMAKWSQIDQVNRVFQGGNNEITQKALENHVFGRMYGSSPSACHGRRMEIRD